MTSTPRTSPSTAATQLLPNIPGFTVGERLGSGSYASVYKAISLQPNSSGIRETVAIKCIDKRRMRSKAAADNLVTEISILKKLRHKHIAHLIDFRWDTQYIYLVLEYCGGGDLSKFIRLHSQLPERVTRKFLRQLASAMYYLHEQNIAHLDLKPHNLLLSSTYRPVLKVADFGFAQLLNTYDDDESADRDTKFRGSLLYMAPEIYKRQQYDSTADLWSIGVILYECLYGVAPFACETTQQLIPQIVSDAPISLPQRQPPLSDDCASLLNGLLQRSPQQRLTFDEFFTHPFVDISRAPSDQSLNKANAYAAQAKRSQDAGNSATAVKLYCQSLEHYLAALQYVDNDTEQTQLRKTISEVLSRAEQCKVSARPPPLLTPRRSESNTEIDYVKQLWSDAPQVAAAFTVVIRAEQFEREEKWQDAFDKYTIAVESMLKLSNMENGETQRRILLRRYIDKWLTRAEMVRAYIDLAQYRLSDVQRQENEVMQIQEATGIVDLTEANTGSNGGSYAQQCKFM